MSVYEALMLMLDFLH